MIDTVTHFGNTKTHGKEKTKTRPSCKATRRPSKENRDRKNMLHRKNAKRRGMVKSRKIFGPDILIRLKEQR